MSATKIRITMALEQLRERGFTIGLVLTNNGMSQVQVDDIWRTHQQIHLMVAHGTMPVTKFP